MFSGCGSLASLQVQTGNAKYHSTGNCLIETATKTLVAGCKTSVIPNDGSVASIGDNAFYNCTGLMTIAIPQSVTKIGAYAFSGCSGLTEVIMSSGVAGIGRSAFEYCVSLAEIVIPDSVTSIGRSAFYNCGGLQRVTFVNPTGWTVIGDSVDLTDPAQNVEYLTTTYMNFDWTRAEEAE